jgi:hypothetical protein
MLGLNLKKPFTKVSQPQTVEAEDSICNLLRKPKWSRPGHTQKETLKPQEKVASYILFNYKKTPFLRNGVFLYEIFNVFF